MGSLCECKCSRWKAQSIHRRKIAQIDRTQTGGQISKGGPEYLEVIEMKMMYSWFGYMDGAWEQSKFMGGGVAQFWWGVKILVHRIRTGTKFECTALGGGGSSYPEEYYFL